MLPVPRTRRTRWLLRFLILELFALGPWTIGQVTRGGEAERWPVLEAEARGLAALLDAHGTRFEQRARDRAQELAALLGQLPSGPLGQAAQGTVLLHLQRRLEEEPELSGYQVVGPKGRILLAAGEEPGGRDPQQVPEVAQAAARPALFLVRGEKTSSLAVAAPIVEGAKLAGIVVARVRSAWLRGLLERIGDGHRASLVDGNGLCLGPCPGTELRRLGSESRPGRTRIGHALAAYAPLESTRAVVLAVGPQARSRRPSAGLLLGLGLLTLAAAGGASLLERW